jgi:predicted transcriptional regulator
MSVSVVDPRQLKKIRVRLGTTQAALGKSAGLSQSLIAKIESGQVDPSFSTVKAIAEALRVKIREGGKKASDVMSKPLVSIQSNAPLSECIALMRKRGISQLPVFSGSQVVGSISEGHLVSLLSSGADPQISLNRAVSKFMEPSYPTVDAGTPIEALYSLFNFVPAVLVTSGDRIEGIITKIDMISAEMK